MRFRSKKGFERNVEMGCRQQSCPVDCLDVTLFGYFALTASQVTEMGTAKEVECNFEGPSYHKLWPLVSERWYCGFLDAASKLMFRSILSQVTVCATKTVAGQHAAHDLLENKR